MNLSFLKFIPGYGALRRHYHRRWSNPFVRFAPPGHFYSPLPDAKFVERYKARLFDRQIPDVPGIELDPEGQLALVRALSQYDGELPFRENRTEGLRYIFQNSFFCHGDAIILYAMLRHFRPRKIVEVGSGFSSAVMLDTNDRFLSRKIEFTFVEPYPERLLSLLSDEDRKRYPIEARIVQDVEIERFSALDAGDILFIDSSHVAKIGSDVVHLLTDVLPRLKDGVIIHFHDVFWPFEYPEAWLTEGRAWNENYILKAFLQFNANFRILLFNSYLGMHHRLTMEQLLPLFMKNPGGSLWIEKTSRRAS